MCFQLEQVKKGMIYTVKFIKKTRTLEIFQCHALVIPSPPENHRYKYDHIFKLGSLHTFLPY